MRFSATLALVCLLSLSALLFVSADDTPCYLDSLSLSGLNIHDGNGLGFSPQVYTYYCNCGSTTASTQLTLTSSATFTEYLLTYTEGNGAHPTSKNPLPVQSGVATETIPLSAGTNSFSIAASCGQCAKTYTISCVKDVTPPASGGLVIGDPQFTGLRGQSYQVHGVSGEVYSIISDEHLQMNSKFVFLNSGACPVVDGEKVTAGCWSHPGSYLGEIGIKTASGDRVKIVSGKADQGFATIELNGKKMKVSQTNELPCPDGDAPGFVSFNNTHTVTVQAGNFLLEFSNSDMFINQRVKVLDWSTLKSHGLLGQTWRSKTYNNPIKHVEGAVDDYVVKGKDLFGDNFLFNQYVPKSQYLETVSNKLKNKSHKRKSQQ